MGEAEKQFTYEDFLGDEPYALLYALASSPNVFERKKIELREQARECGVTAPDFNRLLKSYIDAENAARRSVYVPNTTNFDGFEKTLRSGEWQAGDDGIYRLLPGGARQLACAHPIAPVERLVNIDTGECKVKLAYRRNPKSALQTLIVGKDTISTNRSITALASSGISVTSSTASGLVDYLNDLENLNYDIIPESKSIGRLGYIPGAGFSPYVDGLVFDGDANFRGLYNCIHPGGSGTEWLRTALECRKMSVTARIMLAASFASPLLSIVGSLPFFVHLWGVDSGTGKTVALMLAASVWGDPAPGSYVQTFNATAVGQEKTAAFLNHLPYCLDELQLTKDSKGRSAFDVYQLAQGVGRTRGRKNGGVELTPTWENCFLTTGESPLTTNFSGAGAVNRVIDIECTSGQVAIEDGHKIAGKLRKNYGHIGRKYVEKLYETNHDIIRSIYDMNRQELMEGDSTEKQAMAAAAIVTADQIATQWFFKDDNALTADDLKTFLALRSEVSAGKRAYDAICDWVAANTAHFIGVSEICMGETYGVLEGSTAFIIRGVFSRFLTESGFSMAATVSYLKANHLIQTRGRNMTRGKRIYGVNTECYALELSHDDADLDDELPL